MKRHTRNMLISLALNSAVLALAPGAHALSLVSYGMAASGSYADSTIEIGDGTRYVNVTNGQTVRFVIGAQSFSYTFNALGNVSALQLSEIAPAGLAVPDVRIYLAPNPLYLG